MQFNDIEKYINEQLSKFDKTIPQLENSLTDRLVKQLSFLQLNKDGNIKRSAANFKKMLGVQRSLNDALTDKFYQSELNRFFKTTSSISDQIEQFYKETFKQAKVSSLTKAIRDGSRGVVVERMTTGLTGALSDALQPILNNAVVSGESYNTLTKQIKGVISGPDGTISRYAKQIATDTLNDYARQYNWALQLGLGFQWYMYSGANMTTTRDFCIACKERRYIHVSEFDKLIEGDFKEFKDIGGKIYERYGLPQGMRLGTNKDNFPLYCGGYNCGHQLRPVYEYLVPKSKRNEIHATDAYKKWKKEQGNNKLI